MILDFDLYGFEKMLDEGLIITYPTKTVVKYIRQKFNLTDDDIDINEDNFILVHQDIKNNNKELYNKIEKILLSSGYYYGKLEEPAIVFEKKFGENIFDELKKSGEIKYLYHISPSINDKKILSKGLIPKSKNYRFNYPERIYFLIDKDVENKSGFIKRVCLELFKPIYVKTLSNEITKDEIELKRIGEYSIFKIDFNKLERISLYKDDNALNFNSYFTVDNIKPEFIEKIDEIKL